MIDIAIRFHPVYSMFTLASLLDKTERFRLHVFISPPDYDDALITWIIANFDDVQIYQADYTTHHMAKMSLQFKRHWFRKNFPINKIVQMYTGVPIFLRELIGNQLPPNSWFKNIGAISSRNVFHNHGMFKSYYDILGIPSGFQTDWTFMIWNWEELKYKQDQDLFFKDGVLPNRKHVNTTDIDAYINGAREVPIQKYFNTYGVSKMPTYMHGKLDPLLELDAIGTLDTINYNIMLRKAYTLDIHPNLLEKDYYNLQSGVQLATPWDLYTKLIDKIPVNLRDARLNEKLLIKSEKQKQSAGKLVTAGFSLGKI